MVKCPAPKALRGSSEEPLDTREHLVRSLIREREEEDLLRKHTGIEEVRDAIHDRPRLARPRSSEHEARAVPVEDGVELLGVQFTVVRNGHVLHCRASLTGWLGHDTLMSVCRTSNTTTRSTAPSRRRSRREVCFVLVSPEQWTALVRSTRTPHTQPLRRGRNSPGGFRSALPRLHIPNPAERRAHD